MAPSAPAGATLQAAINRQPQVRPNRDMSRAMPLGCGITLA